MRACGLGKYRKVYILRPMGSKGAAYIEQTFRALCMGQIHKCRNITIIIQLAGSCAHSWSFQPVSYEVSCYKSAPIMNNALVT